MPRSHSCYSCICSLHSTNACVINCCMCVLYLDISLLSFYMLRQLVQPACTYQLILRILCFIECKDNAALQSENVSLKANNARLFAELQDFCNVPSERATFDVPASTEKSTLQSKPTKFTLALAGP